jgi:apolipoprotein D and lipocalin family protein
MRRRRLVLLPLALVLLGLESVKLPPVPTVASVDLPRYMGRWYVIANIPTSFEKGAHNSVESYTLNEDGTIQTLFTCRKDSFDGETKTMKPRAFVRDATNAAWGLQFVWPLKVEHLIAYLSPDYSQTIIARTKRDYVWIMARTPTIPDADYESLAARVAELGYDRTKLQRVPQRW